MTEKAISTMAQQAFEQLAEGQFDDAVEAFSACLVVEPGNAKFHQGRGMAQVQLKKWDAAYTDFKTAYDAEPEDAENAIGLAVSLAMRNEVYPGLGILEKYLTRHPKHARVHILLGLLNFKLGAIAQGKEYLKKALECRPTLVERRMIESTLVEQEKLDQKRYYKPDFHALNVANEKRFAGLSWFGRLKAFFRD
jgi:Flp pilus assembly protein TadD